MGINAEKEAENAELFGKNTELKRGNEEPQGEHGKNGD